MVFCTKCGTQIGASDRFCGSCGTAAVAPPSSSSSSSSTTSGSSGIKSCARCGQEVLGVGYEYNGASYHEPCFRCQACKCTLNGVPFVMRGGQPICNNCQLPRAKNVSNCAGCGAALSGKMLAALDKKWHPECFKCSGCHKTLTGAFMEKGGNPYCAGCLPQTTTVTYGQRRPGFTIDPITGEKKYRT
ncbi:PDZ and LIM domain protein 7 [Balamuthia mandrillaris]